MTIATHNVHSKKTLNFIIAKNVYMFEVLCVLINMIRSLYNVHMYQKITRCSSSMKNYVTCKNKYKYQKILASKIAELYTYLAGLI